MTTFKYNCLSAAGLAIVLGFFASNVSAEQKSLSHNNQAAIYAVMATITVKPEAFEQFVEETLPLIKESRAESGLSIYQLHQSKSNPLQFMWYEHFNDKAAFDFHVQTAHVSSWAKVVGDLASVQLVAIPFQLIESSADITRPGK
ncbi:antibiotic biosynthesis monooxygenase [Pseudomonas sp. REP124]|uniref:putative quinol monooxygenase n=1 Tax=Pseudomonas sp. REP124 TaxID=2875731 RepID=UPI001CCD6B35|nr:putative quinol monooxygenase [Pseudomonas sp. REP124]MBZ9780253.1 antibiotic biosynthesis monooxygenase [Pseudomonas sp. REP124]